MAGLIFDDKNKKPSDKMLKDALGKTYKLWEEIKKHLKKEYGQTTEDWKFHNVKSGWLLKTYQKKRNLFFLFPLKIFLNFPLFLETKLFWQSRKVIYLKISKQH